MEESIVWWRRGTGCWCIIRANNRNNIQSAATEFSHCLVRASTITFAITSTVTSTINTFTFIRADNRNDIKSMTKESSHCLSWNFYLGFNWLQSIPKTHVVPQSETFKSSVVIMFSVLMWIDPSLYFLANTRGEWLSMTVEKALQLKRILDMPFL